MTRNAPGPVARGVPAELRDALVRALGESATCFEGPDLAHHAADRSTGPWPVQAGGILWPATVAQVQEVARVASRFAHPIVPSGGRTGLAGGATATGGELVLSLARLRKIHEVDVASRTLVCDGGVTVEEVAQAAAGAGLFYPVDFAAKGSAHIAGSIATNAGGVRVVRHGSTRAHVLGLDVVLASGELLRLGGRLYKDNTGYDLKQLFIGSEGTLGVIVGATLRLATRPPEAVVALAALHSDDAVLRLWERVLRAGVPVSAFECFDALCLARVLAHRGRERGPFAEAAAQHVLLELEPSSGGQRAREATLEELTSILDAAAEAGEIEDAVVASTPAQARDLWTLREEISEALHPRKPLKFDVTLPTSTLAHFVAEVRERVAAAAPGVPLAVFGHVGDGNLHLALLRPEGSVAAEFFAVAEPVEELVYEAVARHQGSVSAEHGIGLLKRPWLHLSRPPAQIELMRALKAVLDPAGLLNPGKIFPVE